MYVDSVTRSDMDAEGTVHDTHTSYVLYLVAELCRLSKPSSAKQASIIAVY
jgi:hypothetical protein